MFFKKKKSKKFQKQFHKSSYIIGILKNETAELAEEGNVIVDDMEFMLKKILAKEENKKDKSKTKVKDE